MNRLTWLLAGVVTLTIIAFVTVTRINQYQSDGQLHVDALQNPVEVIRDEKGMAYIRAENLLDAIKAQGFITAQDRLFQMQLTKVLVQGRLAEVFGEAARDSDLLQRTLGFYRAAHKHAALLDDPTRQIFESYAEGVNQYIEQMQHEHPLELRLAGLELEPWQIIDSLAIIYYMGWGSAANIQAEIISQKLIEKLGYEAFMTLSPVNINPEDKLPIKLTAIHQQVASQLTENGMVTFAQDPLLDRFTSSSYPLAMGSNNWVMAAEHASGGKPIVVNDPHLSTRILPTTLYPIGLFTADVRAVGVNVPGIPSILIGRNDYVAAGVTNQYGDAQDLYIETVDPNNPDHYLHGELSIPFEVIEESIKIKDDNAPNGVRNEKLQVRLTARGPVISNLHKDLSTDKVITVRWSPLESMQPSLGIDMLLRAQSVTDIKASLTNFTAVHLNYVFADVQGGVGWQTTGKLPIRARGNGTIPMQVLDGEDNWMGWIPYPEMPQRYDAPRGWLGTANHKTVTQDYPYYYSNWFSPANRYQRIMELLDTPNIKTVADHWQFMRDDLNVTARDISPIFVKALSVLDETTELAEILAEWDFREKVDSIATSIYQQTYRNLVALVFKDELGEMLGDVFISNNYFWQERFGLMLKQRESDWFDDITTKENTETLTELIQAAGLKTIADLSTAISPDPQQWQWGKIHQIEFVNPIRRKGVGKDWLGGGNYAMAGSGDTLLRALYPLNKQGNLVAYSAALRMVVDLSDPDKVLAVSPGGISGRTFTAHFKDQIPAYMNGEKRYWWFSDKEIDKHAVSRLYLQP